MWNLTTLQPFFSKISKVLNNGMNKNFFCFFCAVSGNRRFKLLIASLVVFQCHSAAGGLRFDTVICHNVCSGMMSCKNKASIFPILWISKAELLLVFWQNAEKCQTGFPRTPSPICSKLFPNTNVITAADDTVTFTYLFFFQSKTVFLLFSLAYEVA